MSKYKTLFKKLKTDIIYIYKIQLLIKCHFMWITHILTNTINFITKKDFRLFLQNYKNTCLDRINLNTLTSNITIENLTPYINNYCEEKDIPRHTKGIILNPSTSFKERLEILQTFKESK